jgi:DNA-binding response OmpR family regulator
LRRAEKQATSQEILRIGVIELDWAGRTTTVNGQAVVLTPSEFSLLGTLMASPGRVFSRLELLDRLQGTAYEGYERTIDVHIRNLRSKIEPVYGAGYRFATRDQG